MKSIECSIPHKIDKENSAMVEIPFKIKQLLLLEHLEFSANSKYQSIVSVAMTDDCEPKQNIPELLLHYNLEYRYNIEIREIGEQKGGRKREFKKSTIKHTYELANNGPSDTDQEYTFYFFVPMKVMALVMRKPKGITCGTFTTQHDLRGGFQKCLKLNEKLEKNGDGCKRTTCKVARGWKRGSPKKFTVTMDFDPDILRVVLGKDDIPGHATLLTAIVKPEIGSVQQRTLAVASTQFQSNRINVQKLKYWPIIVGICIGTLIVAAILFALYRSGHLSKLRLWHVPEPKVEGGKIQDEEISVPLEERKLD